MRKFYALAQGCGNIAIMQSFAFRNIPESGSCQHALAGQTDKHYGIGLYSNRVSFCDHAAVYNAFAEVKLLRKI